MVETNTRVPAIGDVIVCVLGDVELKYFVCKIDGEGFTLVPMGGLFAGRIYKSNRYDSLEEMHKALNDNVASFTPQGSSWSISE